MRLIQERAGELPRQLHGPRFLSQQMEFVNHHRKITEIILFIVVIALNLQVK